MIIPQPSSSPLPLTETTDIGRPNPTVSLPVSCLSHQTPIPTTRPFTLGTAVRGPRIDRLLLTHCRQEFVGVQPLLRVVPRATLYRHLAKLSEEGSLSQRGRTYRTTAEGLRRLAAVESTMDWQVFDGLFPPLQGVPSVQHRAIIELILAAIVARRASLQDDHHPAFVLFGHTLAWKTSLARFLCSMLGLDPSTHIINLASESGQSLWLRKDARGEVTFRREILSAPFLTFDEYLEAHPKVRTVIQHFLSGRTAIPFENSVLSITPVCFVTMNARPKPSLEGRTTFTAPQLRRLILCDVDQVAIPDLARIGQQPLQAAARYPSITIPASGQDCQPYRPQILRLVRDLITPEAQSLIDVDMVMLLCSGMTGFINDPERAIQQTLYNLCLVKQTLGWVHADWLAVVSAFCLHDAPTASLPAPVIAAHSTTTLPDTILLRRRIMDERESIVPKFSISDELKARLIWLSEQEGIPVEHAVDVLLDYYKNLGDRDLDDLNSVIRLGRDLKCRELSAQAVHHYLQLIQALVDRKQTLDHVEAALEMLPVLERAGLSPGSVPGAETIEVAARLTASGVTLTEVERWLARRQRRPRSEVRRDSQETPSEITSAEQRSETHHIAPCQGLQR